MAKNIAKSHRYWHHAVLPVKPFKAKEKRTTAHLFASVSCMHAWYLVYVPVVSFWLAFSCSVFFHVKRFESTLFESFSGAFRHYAPPYRCYRSIMRRKPTICLIVAVVFLCTDLCRPKIFIRSIFCIHINCEKLLMPPPEFIKHICNMVEAFQVAQQFKALEIINCTAFYLNILFNERVFI